MKTRQIECEDEAERLFVEQAQVMYREMREHARRAPDGEVLDRTEQLALVRGRELTRRALESVIQTEITDLEKKLRPAALAHVAALASTAVVETGKSSRQRAR